MRIDKALNNRPTRTGQASRPTLDELVDRVRDELVIPLSATQLAARLFRLRDDVDCERWLAAAIEAACDYAKQNAKLTRALRDAERQIDILSDDVEAMGARHGRA